jgi:cytochrome b561
MQGYSRFSKQTIFLHWLIALWMIGLLAVGVYMHETKSFDLYPIHKSMGVLILGFVFWRVWVRAQEGWPEPLRETAAWQLSLAQVIKWVLIIATLLMPISGMMMSGFGGHGFGIFSFEIVARNLDEWDTSKVVPYNAFLAEMGEEVHEIGGNLLIAAVSLHALAAIKHHFIDKDATLRRMLGR